MPLTDVQLDSVRLLRDAANWSHVPAHRDRLEPLVLGQYQGARYRYTLPRNATLALHFGSRRRTHTAVDTLRTGMWRIIAQQIS